MFLDIHCVTYTENMMFSLKLHFDMAPYNETWKTALFALCEDTQEKKGGESGLGRSTVWLLRNGKNL